MSDRPGQQPVPSEHPGGHGQMSLVYEEIVVKLQGFVPKSELQDFRNKNKEEISELKDSFRDLKSDLSNLKRDVGDVKTTFQNKVNDIQRDFLDLKNDVKIVGKDVVTIRLNMETMKGQIDSMFDKIVVRLGAMMLAISGITIAFVKLL